MRKPLDEPQIPVSANDILRAGLERLLDNARGLLSEEQLCEVLALHLQIALALRRCARDSVTGTRPE
jgi:hypothetical protein